MDIENIFAQIQELVVLTEPDASGPSIFKVPSHLYGENTDEKLYEPQLVSIGPYHRGKDHLKVMEVDKRLVLKHLINRISAEHGVNNWLPSVVEISEIKEPLARECYTGSFTDIKKDAFVEMMILDGCFVVELIRYSEDEKLKGNKNIHSLSAFTLERVKRDLLLFENQLPLFILLNLFHMISDYHPNGKLPSSSKVQDEKFVTMATKFFSGTNSDFQFVSNPGADAKHLLALLHKSWFPSREHPIQVQNSNPRKYRKLVRDKESDENVQFIPSATQLIGAGIQFKKFERGNSTDSTGIWLFNHIKFDDKGTMWIPTIYVNDDTETMLRNLVVYEQSGYKETCSRLVTDYIIFMDCLINTGKDVELLCRCGIIDNWFGDHEVVASMFNRLRSSLLISEGDFFYTETFKKVNQHYNKRWNKWKANLHENYFNSPWSIISFLAAVFLILLAVIQVVYAYLSYTRFH